MILGMKKMIIKVNQQKKLINMGFVRLKLNQ